MIPGEKKITWNFGSDNDGFPTQLAPTQFFRSEHTCDLPLSLQYLPNHHSYSYRETKFARSAIWLLLDRRETKVKLSPEFLARIYHILL